ncbi:MAG TPA: pentapeptide repeat-containing protein, partial [Planctomycetota bacterium]|nr:pentapeptide repeat-containing protein [Planctomycetota bacterium]
SGLVDSTIPGEGSRTGFYTDESLDDHFRAPEEVRKANLRRCDLRGAIVEGTDFYLVDVRGARLEPEQREWLKRCRAIVDRK